MDRDDLTKALVEIGFKKKGKSNLLRRINDVVQLVNFQKSLYSEEIYINFAVWPLILGEPTEYKEYKFPVRGRIGAIVKIVKPDNCDLKQEFISALQNGFSSFNDIKILYMSGLLKSISVYVGLKKLMDDSN